MSRVDEHITFFDRGGCVEEHESVDSQPFVMVKNRQVLEAFIFWANCEKTVAAAKKTGLKQTL